MELTTLSIYKVEAYTNTNHNTSELQVSWNPYM